MHDKVACYKVVCAKNGVCVCGRVCDTVVCDKDVCVCVTKMCAKDGV